MCFSGKCHHRFSSPLEQGPRAFGPVDQDKWRQEVRKRFDRDESGTSSAEYALILAVISVALGGAVLSLGANLNGAMGSAKNNMEVTTVVLASSGGGGTGTGTGTGTGGTTCPPGQSPNGSGKCK
ncbi:MAG: Flp family type IVb pilin [Sphingomonadales bacterium]|nr:Flp family type IVb pilin [Sphingomonadales bacterium]